MTAPVDPAQFAFALLALGEREQVAAMWRGAMMDRFAKLEMTALECLVALQGRGDSAVSLKCGHVAWNRFALLAEAVQKPAYDSWSGRVGQTLQAIEAKHQLRTGLAHGRSRVSGTGVTLHWHAVEKGEPVLKSLSVPWPQMLAHLGELDQLVRDLPAQLGQIKRIAKSATTGA